jgi:uncharacterized protein
MADEEYLKGLEKWRADMDANLRRENDRLALAGLFWLQKGFNTFGSSRDCDIILPKPAPRIIGAFEYDGSNVTLTLDLGQSVEINGEPVTTATVLNTDDVNPPSYVTYQTLRMVTIRRAHRVGVRLWDNERPERLSFPGRSWFDPDEQFRVSAAYTPYPAPAKVSLLNNLGELEDVYMHGYVSFRLLGRGHRLDAAELSDGRLYIQFRDTTNGFTTYAHGRYVYSEPVQEEGFLVIDFNQAFNPPSAFSPYSTSTFAHKRNMMKVPLEAGEKHGG